MIPPVVQEEPSEPTDTFCAQPFQIAARMEITTSGEINSKEEYTDCTVSLTADACPEWNLTDVAGGIRWRGNSSLKWYPKKPYRIKFAKKQSVMGLPKAKSWVLLAEYRDPTDLMNAFVFELGQLCGLPFTNHNRYVELTLNGEPQGLYHLTEQVQQGDAGRVEVDADKGILMQFDVDDGPQEAPEATDNFWSALYQMPVCVKNPENLDPQGLNTLRGELEILERAINQLNYTRTCELLDIGSMIDFLIIQELVYNVELDAPRSMYIHRQVGGKWTMGPLWDFDAGFDFDWGHMQTGHHFFADTRELVMGTNPVTHAGTQYQIPGFFSDLFRVKAFKEAYKARWAQVYGLIPQALDATEAFYKANPEAWQREAVLWPIGLNDDNGNFLDTGSQVKKLRSWVLDRAAYLDHSVIPNY